MQTSRKSKIVSIKTRSEMESLVREIAALKLGERQIAARMDADIQAVRENYEPRLSQLAGELLEKTATARTWAQANRAEFCERRSIDFGHGVAGFRTAPPKLTTLLKWKWDGVLESLRGSPGGRVYIRVKEEVNKEQIIADVSAGILAETDLRNAGAQVVREEIFFVEPKLTRVNLREAA